MFNLVDADQHSKHAFTGLTCVTLHLYATVHMSFWSDSAPLPVPVFVSVGHVGCVCTYLCKQLHLPVPLNINCSLELSHVTLH